MKMAAQQRKSTVFMYYVEPRGAQQLSCLGYSCNHATCIPVLPCILVMFVQHGYLQLYAHVRTACAYYRHTSVGLVY